PRDVVVHEQHAQLPRRHAGGAQRDVLGDGVILAVAEPGLERAAAAGKRRRPLVGRAPLRHVAGVADGVVDALVDEVEAHAALVRARLLHDRGETGGGGRAGGLVGKAAQERRLLRADVGGGLAPFHPHDAVGGDEREETEGLVVSGAGPGVAAFAVRGIGRRGGIVGGGAAAGGVGAGAGAASAAMTIGCGAGRLCAGWTGAGSCGAIATDSPAATLAMTGTLFAAVAFVSIADTATKPRNSTTGSHWA